MKIGDRVRFVHDLNDEGQYPYDAILVPAGTIGTIVKGHESQESEELPADPSNFWLVECLGTVWVVNEGFLESV